MRQFLQIFRTAKVLKMARKKSGIQSAEPQEQKTEQSDLGEPTVITEEIAVEAPQVDVGQILAQLRVEHLDVLDLVRIAQQLAPADVDMAGVLGDEDEGFVGNFLAVLGRRNYWNEDAARLAFGERDQVAEAAFLYVQRMLKQNPAHLVEYIGSLLFVRGTCDFEGASQAHLGRVKRLEEEMRVHVCSAIVASGSTEIAQGLQNHYNALMEHAEEKQVTRLLFDGSGAIRRATLRMLTTQKTCSVGLLSSALVLLKDSDVAVRKLVLVMAQRYAHFPELTIPQVFGVMLRAEGEELALCLDVIKKFDNEAVPIVLSLMADTRDGAEGALRAIVGQAPLRWVEHLLRVLLSFHSPDYVAQRAQGLLASFTIDDKGLKERIQDAIIERQERVHPRSPKFADMDAGTELLASTPLPVAGFDTEVLGDKELKKAVKSIDLEHLLRFLNDGRDLIKINAMNLARVLKINDEQVLERIAIRLHESDVSLVMAAIEALHKLAPHERYVSLFLRVFEEAALETVRNSALAHINTKEDVALVMELFHKKPKAMSTVVRRLLEQSVRELIVPYLLGWAKVGERNEVAEYVLGLLIAAKIDCEPIRGQLEELISEHCFYNENVKRRRALHLLKKMQRNEKTIAFLLEYIRHVANTEIKKLILSIFKVFEVDYFEDDEEEDDFGDL